MIGLYAFVLYTTVGDAINLDRSPALINATSVPAATFDIFVQNERRASLVYLAAPTAANQAQLAGAQAATTQALPTFRAKMTSAATTRAATTAETASINTMLADIDSLNAVRSAVSARAISPTQVFGAYSRVITDELDLFLKENASLTDISAATQSMAVIDTTEAREALLQEDALISAALAAHRLTPATRVQVAQLAGARTITLQNGLSRLHPNNLAAFEGPLDQAAPTATQNELTTLENAVAGDPTPFPPFTAGQWDPVVKAVATGYFNGGVNASEYEVSRDRHTALNAWRRVALSGGLGLLGLLLSIIVSTLIGRRIIRRLRGLRATADELANEQLPDVVARLRRGEDVPVEQMAGQTTDLGRDEIGQVGQAFDAARQTAIEAAVGEARMRRGISDVFRNLARRNQSLLHRQLSSLDQMERRTSDPETLEDLFRLDHLTTRMRRHSEGLIILSGAAPGRGWVHPVRMVDVLRGAAAEVEDYSRVTVTCPSQAALQGPAVADVIHLLAELIENATTLSPPYTPVRVSGDLVANGFAVEIEDRGLGMSEQRFAELNGRLAEPPEFDVFHSEQLGLFVVGQLAKRHGIRVTLRPSPFGGTTAIALIPTELVGVEEGFMEGLPAGMSAVSSSLSAGRPAAGDDLMVQPSAQRTQLTGGQPWGALTQGAPANGSGGPPAANGGTGQPAADPFDAFAPTWGSPEAASGTTSPANGSGTPGDTEPHFPADPFASQPYSGYTAPSFGSDPFAEAPPGGRPYSDGPAPAGSGETGTGRPWPYDREPPAANGAGQPGPAYTPGEPAGAGGTPPWYPQAESPFPAARSPFPPAEPPFPPADFPSAQPAAGSPYPEPEPPAPPAHAGPAPAAAAEPSPASQAENPYPAADESYKGLPRRVRQASLAPQLRDKTASRPAAAASGDSGPERSPEQIRSALSAIQRGWQEGRESGDETPAGETGPGGPLAGRPAATADAAPAGEEHAGEGRAGDPASTLSWPITNATAPADHPPAGGNGEGDGRAGNGGYADYSAQPVYSDDQSSTERRGEPAEAEQSHRGASDDT
ncbi:MAG TPA: nitrate- and nitrite sensing domain-containing protein [Streptosporangiaceae bacterium]